MKKAYLSLIVAMGIIVLLVGVFVYAFVKNDDNKLDGKANISNLKNINKSENIQNNRVCYKDKCFDVEVADTNKERAIGLMGEENLPYGSGMLFVFENSKKHSFWMKNMNFPIDILWIDNTGKVSFIKKGAKPCKEDKKCESIIPSSKGKYVLELNSGVTKDLSINEGDKLDIYYQTDN